MIRQAPRKRVLAIATLFLIAFALIVAFSTRRGGGGPVAYAATVPQPTAGELQILDSKGGAKALCPLKHTDVVADISGYVAHVHVVQTFTNPSTSKVEAVYVFPLPDEAAVDCMTMTIGDRKISAEIKERQDAQRIYQQAKAGGHVAALLDQERPNIFTQSVANIEPGATVTIDISFVETLKLEDGTFEWVFPMVVGPRYNGGSTVKGGQVPDVAHITPPITPKGTRAGHDISVTVHLDAGMPIADIKSLLHDVDITNDGPGRSTIALKDQATIPNKDFILRYRTATDQIGDSFVTHTDTRGTYFTLTLQPPRKVQPDQIVPKEIVFVIDQTGSQSGAPIEKAKETIKYAIKHLNPGDTFQLLGFNTSVYPCFPGPVPATQENITKALDYLKPIEGEGGTDILQAVDYVLKIPSDPQRLRIVCYMTDGYVGNDQAIIDYIKLHRGSARMFPFGTGNSVNRFLIDGMARAGGGEPEYVNLNSDGAEAAQSFYNRIRIPVLTNISVDWGTLAVTEVYPRQSPDLFSAKPIMIQGRLSDLRSGTVTIHGMTAAGPFERSITLTPTPGNNPALPSLWARAKIDDITLNDDHAELGTVSDGAKKQITNLGLAYHLTTEYTSFVAVEWKRTTVGGETKRVEVPVEMPDGVQYEGANDDKSPQMAKAAFSSRSAAGYGGGMPGGGGAFGGVVHLNAQATTNAPAPMAVPPPAAPPLVEKDEATVVNPSPQANVSVRITGTAKVKPSVVACAFDGQGKSYLTQQADLWSGSLLCPADLSKGYKLTIDISDKNGDTHEVTISATPNAGNTGFTITVVGDVDLSNAALDLGAGNRLPLTSGAGWRWQGTVTGALPKSTTFNLRYANGQTVTVTL